MAWAAYFDLRREAVKEVLAHYDGFVWGCGAVAMKQVGARREAAIAQCASGLLLAQGARFSEALARLSPSTFIPKGIYRFKSHEDANRHAEHCLVRGMARLAAGRG